MVCQNLKRLHNRYNCLNLYGQEFGLASKKFIRCGFMFLLEPYLRSFDVINIFVSFLC